MSQDSQPAFRRILLKLSGEALMGQQSYGVDPDVLAQVAEEVSELSRMGVEVGIVIGGGNIFRGAGLAQGGMDRVTGDHMGMLATVINALALQDAIERAGRFSRVMSAIRINQVCEDYIRRRAVRHLEKGRIVVFAAGTGNPFFTTDSAASLRAIEINADIMIKATKVDGVYDADPMTTKDARRYERLTFDDALEQRLGVMDTTALVMCRDNGLPIRVMNMFAKGDLQRLVMGEAVGTLVEGARNE
ncbi:MULTISPECIES: UMP kinase [Thioalkalivibrio]|uniref:Uridylate kinase n=1 Tax=Thioalkalivibrio versutus TaxID=106634 RepID=A0A0G3G8Q5_9GAMM|nr:MULTISPECIES: UMP kinase [Thioalkalivibrio]AKJ95176.1 uridylate kinase [Thioalkalivibrio versutus]OOC50899.1 UMP kinase [Thioalkalivibrio versutus]